MQDLVALLLTARETDVHRAVLQGAVHLPRLHRSFSQGEKVYDADHVEASEATDRVHCGAQEVEVANTGNLGRVLERQEQPSAGPFLWCEREQIESVVRDGPGHVVAVTSSQDVGQGALAGSVGAHDRMYLTRVDREVKAIEDLLLADRGRKVIDVQHQPTLPSKLTLRSR